MKVHWKVSGDGTMVAIAVEMPKSSGYSGGWFAIAWSKNGAMGQSDAVIGNVNGGPVKAYYMPYQGQVDATSKYSIGSTSVFSTTSAVIYT